MQYINPDFLPRNSLGRVLGFTAGVTATLGLQKMTLVLGDVDIHRRVHGGHSLTEAEKDSIADHLREELLQGMEDLKRKVNRAVEDAMRRRWESSVARIGSKSDARSIEVEDVGDR
jgi:hypothetical protein